MSRDQAYPVNPEPGPSQRAALGWVDRTLAAGTLSDSLAAHRVLEAMLRRLAADANALAQRLRA